ncbi:beta-phosphoglucomutase [Lactobacillus selangorensis]|nr:beta-phosphoglucomutase [Lactobacillus selangorensis]
MLKGFTFDLDGVITDTANYHFAAWKKMAHDELGIDLPDSMNDKLKGISRMDSLDIILKFGHKENDYTQAQKEQFATDKNNLYLDSLKNMSAKDILPGVKPFLDSIKQAGYPMSLASASKNAPTILNKLGLTDYFDAIVDPATLKHGKPNPEIYQKAAEAIHEPDYDCVGLEDAAAGIQAINAADQFSVGIGDKDVLSKADLIFPSTADLSLTKIEEAYKQARP